MNRCLFSLSSPQGSIVGLVDYPDEDSEDEEEEEDENSPPSKKARLSL